VLAIDDVLGLVDIEGDEGAARAIFDAPANQPCDTAPGQRTNRTSPKRKGNR
jgi:hypothetical protein